MNPQTTKFYGELAELKFQFLATKKGLVVSKPLGDNQPYDYVIEKEGKLFKFQIKSSRCKKTGGHYLLNVRRTINKIGYEAVDYDYVAVHLFDADVWYIIPFSEIGEHFYVGKQDKYLKFKDNWDFQNVQNNKCRLQEETKTGNFFLSQDVKTKTT